MPATKSNNERRLRQTRIEATKQTQPITTTIQRAKAYVQDQIWLSPVELKSTIIHLTETLESMLATPPQVVQSAEQAGSKPRRPKRQGASRAAVETSSSLEIQEPSKPAKSAPATPTHVGTVLGLKGREDYEAQLVQSGSDHMTDQHGRAFNLKDYGYDEEEAYRLDLSSLRQL